MKFNTVLIIDVHARDIIDAFVRDRWVSLASLYLQIIRLSSISVCLDIFVSTSSSL